MVDSARADQELLWKPGWEWFAAVVAIHALATAPWLVHMGPWPLAPCALSLLYHAWVLRRGEVWRFALVEDRVLVFEPPRRQRSARPAKLRGPAWMTERLVVVRTSRRVLVLRAGRVDAALFARLRRGLLSPAAW